jgi:hypothetical protein
LRAHVRRNITGIASSSSSSSSSCTRSIIDGIKQISGVSARPNSGLAIRFLPLRVHHEEVHRKMRSVITR